MTIAPGVRLRRPCVTPGAANGLQGEATFAAIRGKNHNAAGRSAATAGIVSGTVIGVGTVGGERSCSAQGIGADDNDSAAGGSAAGLRVAIGVVTAACTSAAAHDHAI